MTWEPKRLTREQMEERRREGMRLIKAGKLSFAAIGRQLGVGRAAVSHWAQKLEEGGWRSLKQRKASGRPSRLSEAQKRKLLQKLKLGALKAGFSTDRWTMERVQQLIRREFGISYHVKYIGRLLRRLGWSWQQPLPRAAERDEELIRAWVAKDWPRIKKGATIRRRHRIL
jgi:transposase